MSIESFFEKMTAEERALKLGYETDNPLKEAFEAKRVVHASLGGRPLAREQAQQVWQRVMEEEPVRGQLQTAYIHIPFCQTKCLYCGFFQNAANQSVEDHYIDLLLEEIENEARHKRFQEGLIQAVFIGGGTPSSLSAENAARLLQAIRTNFPLANDYELTLEGRIHDLVPEKMDAWFTHGVNRVSLGVQSFHTKVRQQLGRLDTQEVVLERLQALKDYNQCSVVVDLIYGLPDQTPELWLEDLKILEASPVDGMDLYQLNVFENSDLNKFIQSGKLSPAATTAEQGAMYALAHDFVGRYNFQRLSACHWSRTARERSLYNKLAKQGHPMFPFGCGAGGNVGGYMTMLHRSLGAYEQSVMAGEKPFMVLMEQSPLQRVANLIVDQLEHCYFDLRPLIRFDERLQLLDWLFERWIERGLCVHNGAMYKLTVAGEFWHVNLTQTVLETMQYILTGENTLVREKIAAQNHKHAATTGHPAGVSKGHPAGVPKGHPVDIPKGHPVDIPKGHPVDIPKGHPVNISKGHPIGIPKEEPVGKQTPLGRMVKEDVQKERA